MAQPRLRIAPSPTGYLHVGTARTALYNYLYAKQQNGVFVLRIEDTDVERSSKEMTEIIIEGLKWLGLNYDEGPFFQSDYFKHYTDYIPELEKTGGIYRCFCTPKELDERKNIVMAEKKAWKYDRKCAHLTKDEINKNLESKKPFAWRVRIPEGKTNYDDMIHGIIEKDNSEIEDFIIVRSDNTPIYNFAVVVDDVRMKITHVVRGDDHISNTFKQIHIYRLLNAEPPRFAHLPLILDENKAKLSKRTGTVSVLAFRDMGVLPEAFVNFIALIGWNPGGDKEIMSLDEMVKLFSFEKVTKKGGVFDYKKLEWMNSKYITNYDSKKLLEITKPFFKEAGIDISQVSEETLFKIMDSVKEKARYLKDIPQLTKFFFEEIKEYDEKGKSKFLTPDRIEHLKVLKERLMNVEIFNHDSVEAVYKAYAEEKSLKGADIIHPTRMALSGKTEGPSLFLMMEIMGKERVLSRLTKIIESDIL
ncbi:TPA: glutamate--tRNA ligase [candidate division WOR-3 bacterium]|jgi:glutamyl-tRNA synthetase|uniref:Glutamate--tRNA ligase n=1 Tax=candidate division WOR-3 bacterium TaxID=2052148 RepID=A0A350H8A6_UNCW3|nr:glutamate--tRNA ligase [candidate division WOR-3 bacterium]